MTTKAVGHTPGPWEIHEVGIVIPGRGVLAEVYGEETEREANLRLIAAAPDMLEALQNMMGAFDNAVRRLKFPGEFQDEAIESARAAIGKAQGQAA